MKRSYLKLKGIRQAKGAAVSEFGPAVYLLLIGFFFPLVDFINIGFEYGCGFTLNYFQACQCAAVAKSEATDPTGLVMFGIPEQWKNMGLGRFCKLVGDPQTEISYKDGQLETNGVQDKNIILSTKISANPLLYVPLFPGVTGLTAPITFQFVQERPLENPDDANS